MSVTFTLALRCLTPACGCERVGGCEYILVGGDLWGRPYYDSGASRGLEALLYSALFRPTNRHVDLRIRRVEGIGRLRWLDCGCYRAFPLRISA